MGGAAYNSSHELLRAPHLLLPEPARQRRSLLCRPRRAGRASTTASRASRPQGWPARARCASTRPAAWTAAPAGRWPWSIPKRSGTRIVDQQDIDEIVESHLKQGRGGGAPAAAARRRPMSGLRMNAADATLQSPARPAPSSARSTRPPAPPRGVAVLCHPHPQHGGTMDNKVVQTLARAFVAAGLHRGALQLPRRRRLGRRLGRRPRRGRRRAGRRRGLAHRGRAAAGAGRLFLRRLRAPARRRAAAGRRARAERWCWSARRADASTSRRCRPHTLVIHGEADDVVPLAAVLDWARPQALPVTVVPGAGHFFHGQAAAAQQISLGACARDAGIGLTPRRTSLPSRPHPSSPTSR